MMSFPRLSPLPTARLALAAACAAATFASPVSAADGSRKTKAKGEARAAAAAPTPSLVTVKDGVVQPRRPITEALADAILFLRKADGGYVPGRIDGPLSGYIMSAHVRPDGTGVTTRQLSFPARHHAYFIRTFLHYYAYTGQAEWLLRARDLADWNIAHSTPADAAYPNLPYSAHQNGKPTGSADKNSIETDKPAFLGSSYLRLYETTGDGRYLEAARKIAATLLPRQREDGSWPFRVIPGDGSIYEDQGGAPVFFVEFFDHLHRHEAKPEYARARDAAARLMIARNVEAQQWGTYHEDIHPKTGAHLSAEPMSFTAAYLFRQAREHPEYLAMGKRVLAQMEAKLVFTEGHAAAPAPAVAEQATFAHIMAGHTARYCLALAEQYRVTHDPALKSRALSGLNAVTYMQSEAGLFRTHFYDTKAGKEKDQSTVNNWYSQHLYTICHILESMAAFPEIVPDGETHLLESSVGVRDVGYEAGAVRYATAFPAVVLVKTGFAPVAVQVDGKPLAAGAAGWSYDAATRVVTVRHGPGRVTITR